MLVTHHSTLNALDKLRKDFDSHVHQILQKCYFRLSKLTFLLLDTAKSPLGSDKSNLMQQQCVIDDPDIEDVINEGGQTVHNAQPFSHLRSKRSVIYRWSTSYSERYRLWRISLPWA